MATLSKDGSTTLFPAHSRMRFKALDSSNPRSTSVGQAFLDAFIVAQMSCTAADNDACANEAEDLQLPDLNTIALPVWFPCNVGENSELSRSSGDLPTSFVIRMSREACYKWILEAYQMYTDLFSLSCMRQRYHLSF